MPLTLLKNITNMRKALTLITAICGIATATLAQAPDGASKNTQPVSKSRVLQVDSAVVTKHQVTIKGQLISYTATAGCMPVWDDDGRPVAGLFYTYYERDGIADRSN